MFYTTKIYQFIDHILFKMAAQWHISLTGDIQRLSEHDPCQMTLGGPAWAEGLDQTTSRGPFQSQQFCDSAIIHE